MVVTEDVKAGTLLAVCNPLAIAFTAPSDFGFQISLSLCAWWGPS